MDAVNLAVLMKLTEGEQQALRGIFSERPSAPCGDCGGFHLRACPRIRRIRWVEAGATAGQRAEVEYWPEWDDSYTIWPEDVYDAEENDDS